MNKIFYFAIVAAVIGLITACSRKEKVSDADSEKVEETSQERVTEEDKDTVNAEIYNSMDLESLSPEERESVLRTLGLNPSSMPQRPADNSQASKSPQAVDNAPSARVAATSDSGYKVTASGLKYKVIKQGTGATPKTTDNVTVHYTGKLLDGTVFDSSVQSGGPITFPLNGVIQGWNEGLQLMKEGSAYTFIIPPHLAYGTQGIANVIPPNSTLIFDVELIKVN